MPVNPARRRVRTGCAPRLTSSRRRRRNALRSQDRRPVCTGRSTPGRAASGSRVPTSRRDRRLRGRIRSAADGTRRGGREATLLGGLAASGWHSCCILMRMLTDGLLVDASLMARPAWRRSSGWRRCGPASGSTSAGHRARKPGVAQAEAEPGFVTLPIRARRLAGRTRW